eukprot:6188067-Pleurochrysis_carterae.AAC.4
MDAYMRAVAGLLIRSHTLWTRHRHTLLTRTCTKLQDAQTRSRYYSPVAGQTQSVSFSYTAYSELAESAMLWQCYGDGYPNTNDGKLVFRSIENSIASFR